MLKNSHLKELQEINNEVINVKEYWHPTFIDLQQRLDKVAGLADETDNPTQYSILVLEVQARLHALNGYIEKAAEFAEDAKKLQGSETPSLLRLKEYITKQSIIRLEHRISHLQEQLKNSSDEIKKLRDSIASIQGFLKLGLLILIVLLYWIFVR